MSAPPPTDIGSLLVVNEGFRQGRPCLRGTGITVHTIAVEQMMGRTSEEVCGDWPDVDAALIHAALAYYFANRAQVEAEIEEDVRYGNELAATYPRGVAADTQLAG